MVNGEKWFLLRASANGSIVRTVQAGLLKNGKDKELLIY
jgi:hypothetical protein